jgi:transposase
MRSGVCLSVSPGDIKRLRALVQDRNAPQKHVWRARIVLMSAEGVGTNAIMRETGKAKTCVWRWQERFASEGFEGLLRDRTRPSRIPKLDPSIAERVVALTMEAPPGETTHWTGAAMAEAAGVSVSSVQSIWRALGLQPHRVRQFIAKSLFWLSCVDWKCPRLVLTSNFGSVWRVKAGTRESIDPRLAGKPELPLGVDFARSPSRQGMTGICAFRPNAGVDV